MRLCSEYDMFEIVSMKKLQFDKVPVIILMGASG